MAGWLAAVSGRKAIKTLHMIHPCLTDPSKKCRAITILKVFDTGVSIKGKHRSAEVFAHCPPPARSRTQNQNSASVVYSQVEAPNAGRAAVAQSAQLSQALKENVPAENSISAKGWLCGMVDGEGYIHIRYRSDRDSMYPRLRLFVKSRPIIDAVARSMGVNPYARRSRGKHLGWYASVSHLKALRVLRLIAPHLIGSSKRCRARKILDAFGEVGTIHSRLISSEFFRCCPPPSRIRKSGRIISNN